MDAIEKAIRTAFEKGDVDDRAFREKVYRSAFAALDRALQANPHLAPEIVEKRRNDLQAKIIEIETEFIPAVPAVEPPVTKPVQPHPDSDWSFIAPMVEPEDGPRTPAASPAAPEVDPVAAAMSRASDPILPIPERAEPSAPKPPAVAVRELDARQSVSERTEPRAADIRPVPSRDAAADSPSPERIEPRAPELQPAPLRDAAVRGPILERIEPLVPEVQPAPLPDAADRRPAPDRIEPRAQEVLTAPLRDAAAGGSMPDRMEPLAPEVRAAPSRDAAKRRPPAERIEPRMAEVPAPASPAINGNRPPAEPQAPEVSVAPARDTRRPVPEVFFPDASDFESSPAAEPEAASDEIFVADGPNVATERRRPFAAIFLGVTLLALAAIGTWWGISTGLIKIPGPSDTEEIAQVPPDDENFTPGDEAGPAKPGQADAGRNWTLVFSPSDPTTVNAPGDTKVDVMKDDTGGFARIRSSASGSAVVFDVPKGILEQISGKHAVFDIVARAEEGKETQFSVDCNFGELGDCGRKRYRASYQKADFLFEMDMPGRAPGSEGTIAINSDIDNGGKSVDVYEIKVSVSE